MAEYDSSGGSGSGTANLTISAHTGNYTILSSDAQKTFTNTGATGTITFTLPSATEGLRFAFRTTAAHRIAVTRAGSNTIEYQGSSLTTLTSKAAKGDFLSLECVTAGEWNVAQISVPKYVRRGTVANFDADQTTMTMDGTWNDFDVSSIVGPAGYGNLVHIMQRTLDSTYGRQLAIRGNGVGDEFNATRTFSAGGGSFNYHYVDSYHRCDSNGVIEYLATASTVDARFLVRGWFAGGWDETAA